MIYRARVRFLRREIQFEFLANNMSSAILAAEDKAKKVFIGAGVELGNWDQASKITIKEVS